MEKSGYLGLITFTLTTLLVGYGLYYLLPNFSDFDVIARTAHGQGIASTILAANSLYALLYVAILLSAAILIFEQREFK